MTTAARPIVVGARRSAASTSSAAIDNGDLDNEAEGVLTGWVGNALVCASMGPVILSIGSLTGISKRNRSALALLFGGLAVMLQIYAMQRYWCVRPYWNARDTRLMALMCLLLAAYIYLTVISVAP